MGITKCKDKFQHRPIAPALRQSQCKPCSLAEVMEGVGRFTLELLNDCVNPVKVGWMRVLKKNDNHSQLFFVRVISAQFILGLLSFNYMICSRINIYI